ncbi:MAG: undecaprenyldiphospho-muramoylpentapeptide beta-N-acetylglucosaminyltransferase [Candidatus Omnitrophota bacterium]|jgi:UDP-N-acetylglucosamine--N-acetylmuramyl-(pentapeptide) pyrophosphoryl-undecaprenol N-acetylglucosamine transferase
MKVILAAGGSGGHIFPSIALASELEKLGVEEVYFVSSKRRLDRNILEKEEHRSFFLSINPMPYRFGPVISLVFGWKLLADTLASAYILIRVRPDCVVGFGGYSSGCIARWAKVFGIPVIIHEQNLVPGRANRILSRVADRVAVSFRESEGHFPDLREKVVYSGNPLRLGMLSNNRPESLKRLGLEPDKLTVLVMGGSQGSTFLNRTASEAARSIERHKGGSVQFIHLTGSKDYRATKDFYKENNIPGSVFSFLERIDDAYAASDLAISRAGAAAIFELAFYAKPMILVPYPSSKNNQRYNAIYFSEKGAAIYKEEADLSPDVLTETVLGVLDDGAKINEMSKAAQSLSEPEAGKRLAREVMSLAKKKREI